MQSSMGGFSTNVSLSVNGANQQPFINALSNRLTEPFTHPSRPRARVDPIQSHLKLFFRTFTIVITLLLLAVLSIACLIIGIIGHERHCDSSYKLSLPIWLLVLGSATILITIALIIIMIMSTTCKYDTSDKKFRIAYILIIAVATSVLGWTVNTGTLKAFAISKSSIQCLGFVYNYCVFILWIVMIAAIIHGIFLHYLLWTKVVRKCLKKKKKNVVIPRQPPFHAPVHTVDTQCIAIQTDPIDLMDCPLINVNINES